MTNSIVVRWRRKQRFSQNQGRDFMPRIIQLIQTNSYSIPHRRLAHNPNVIMSDEIRTSARFRKFKNIIQNQFHAEFFDSHPEPAIVQLESVNDRRNSRKKHTRHINMNIQAICARCNAYDELMWFSISAGINIVMDDIENNPNLLWNWRGISANPNITLEFIKKYFYKLDVDMLCANPLYFDDAVHNREIKRSIAARRSLMRELLNAAVYKDNAAIIIYIDFE
jgi:hypothetical protein